MSFVSRVRGLNEAEQEKRISKQQQRAAEEAKGTIKLLILGGLMMMNGQGGLGNGELTPNYVNVVFLLACWW